MLLTREQHELALKNSEFILLKLAEAKPGDNIVMLGDTKSYEYSYLFAECARNLGMNICIIDVGIYGGDEKYTKLPIMEPVKQAVLNADITFMVTPQVQTGFDYFIGSKKEADAALAGKGGKRFILEIDGLDKWHINEEQVMMNRRRAVALYNWLKRADEVHVTTEKGTDLYVKVGEVPDGMYPVMGIIPFYSEVAIVPSFHSVHGVVIADGATERAYNQHGFPIRPNLPGQCELWMEPFRMEYEDSYLVRYSGNPVQVARLDKLMEDIDPKPELCDELGIVTTNSPENGIYGWKEDQSHSIGCVHVAIGNNHQRGEIIHSTEHIDFDINLPTVSVDGQVIIHDGVFEDELILKMGEQASVL